MLLIGALTNRGTVVNFILIASINQTVSAIRKRAVLLYVEYRSNGIWEVCNGNFLYVIYLQVHFDMYDEYYSITATKFG